MILPHRAYEPEGTQPGAPAEWWTAIVAPWRCTHAWRFLLDQRDVLEALMNSSILAGDHRQAILHLKSKRMEAGNRIQFLAVLQKGGTLPKDTFRLVHVRWLHLIGIY